MGDSKLIKPTSGRKEYVTCTEGKKFTYVFPNGQPCRIPEPHASELLKRKDKFVEVKPGKAKEEPKEEIKEEVKVEEPLEEASEEPKKKEKKKKGGW